MVFGGDWWNNQFTNWKRSPFTATIPCYRIVIEFEGIFRWVQLSNRFADESAWKMWNVVNESRTKWCNFNGLVHPVQFVDLRCNIIVFKILNLSYVLRTPNNNYFIRTGIVEDFFLESVWELCDQHFFMFVCLFWMENMFFINLNEV